MEFSTEAVSQVFSGFPVCERRFPTDNLKVAAFGGFFRVRISSYFHRQRCQCVVLYYGVHQNLLVTNAKPETARSRIIPYYRFLPASRRSFAQEPASVKLHRLLFIA
jgi:hypothetical protein